ncbi:hypothetical protein [Spirochaeta africana]|nr:hypothetical protein [Spirochaeta africana]
MQLVIDEATDRVRLASEAIFGEPGAEDIEVTLSASEKVAYFITRTIEEVRKTDYGPGVETVMREVQEKRYRTVDHKGSATRSPGLFGKHVGFAPQLKDGDDIDVTKARYDFDYNIRFEGEGQMGRIMYAYLNYNLIEARGWSELAKPAWDRRMYNDDGHWISAPTVRQVGMTAVGVAATVASAGVGTGFVGVLASTAISTGVTATGNLAFGMMDVAGGYMDMDDMLLGVGKQAAIGMATGMIGGSSSLLTGKLAVTSTIGNMAMQGATMAASNAAVGAINAITLEDGEWGWDREVFTEATIGRNAVAGYVGGMAGNITTQSLGRFNLHDSNGIALGSTIFDTENIGAFNSFAGGMTSSAIQYGMTGETTMNLLNLTDVTKIFGMDPLLDRDGNELRMGFFEMRLGGGTEHMFGLGSGGMDIGYSSMTAALSGLSETMQIAGLRFGGEQGKATLNAVNALSYTSSEMNHALGRQIFDRDIDVLYGELGENFIGQFDASKPATIAINSSFLGSGAEKAAQLASILSHEGTHLYGSTSEVGAYAQQTGTYMQLMGAWGEYGVGDESFLMESMMQTMRPTNPEPVDGISNAERLPLGGSQLGVEPRGLIGIGLLRSGESFETTASRGVDGFLFGSLRTAVADVAGLDVFTERLLPSEHNPAIAMDTMMRQRELYVQGAVSLASMLLSFGGGVSAGQSVGSAAANSAVPGYLSRPDNLFQAGGALLDATSHALAFSAMINSDSSASYTVAISGSVLNRNNRTLLANTSFFDLPDYSTLTGFGAWNRDRQVFGLAEAAGIPLAVDNQWQGNEQAQADVTNQMMRNYMFVHSMSNTFGIDDPERLRQLYYEGAPMPTGQNAHGQEIGWTYAVIPFADVNTGPWQAGGFSQFVDQSLQDMMNTVNMIDFSHRYPSSVPGRQKEYDTGLRYYDDYRREVWSQWLEFDTFLTNHNLANGGWEW